jgi:hypothetical protein
MMVQKLLTRIPSKSWPDPPVDFRVYVFPVGASAWSTVSNSHRLHQQATGRKVPLLNDDALFLAASPKFDGSICVLEPFVIACLFGSLPGCDAWLLSDVTTSCKLPMRLSTEATRVVVEAYQHSWNFSAPAATEAQQSAIDEVDRAQHHQVPRTAGQRAVAQAALLARSTVKQTGGDDALAKFVDGVCDLPMSFGLDAKTPTDERQQIALRAFDGELQPLAAQLFSLVASMTPAEVKRGEAAAEQFQLTRYTESVYDVSHAKPKVATRQVATAAQIAENKKRSQERKVAQAAPKRARRTGPVERAPAAPAAPTAPVASVERLVPVARQEPAAAAIAVGAQLQAGPGPAVHDQATAEAVRERFLRVWGVDSLVAPVGHTAYSFGWLDV